MFKSAALVFLSFTVATLLIQETNAQSGQINFKCKNARTTLKKLICDTVVPQNDVYRQDSVTWDAFEVTVRHVDLNGDGKNEVVVWESSWAGTSGGGLWVLSKVGSRYRKILETDTTWSPVILLKSKTKGWNDLAYYVTGGGVESVFVTLRFNNSKYRGKTVSKETPRGKVLIGRNWGNSVFGPITR